MKLLTPKEHESVIKKEEAKDKEKAKQIAEETANLIRNFNSFRDDIKKAEEKLSFEHQHFLDSLHEGKTQLEQEVESLEARKKKALEPLEQKEKELASREIFLLDKKNALEKKDQDLETRDQDLNKLASLYEDRLDDLNDREETLLDREEHHIFETQAFNETCRAREKDFEERSILLNAKANMLKNQESILLQKGAALDTIQQELEKEKQKLEVEKKHIASQQKTLKLAFDEARQKGIS